MLIPILVTVIIVVLALWLISILPLPTGEFPIKTVLYVLVVVVAIFYLLKFLPYPR